MSTLRRALRPVFSGLLVLAGGHLAGGTLACGNASPPAEAPAGAAGPASASSATRAAGSAPADDGATKAAALEALTAGEAKSGSCDPGHQAALEKLIAEVEEGMKTKTGEDG